MAINKDTYNHLKDDKRIKEELAKLNKIYTNIPKDKKALCNKLIENAAFMGVLLEDLAADLQKNGYTEEYKNGADQYGRKKSIAADLYNATIKNYVSTIKHLSDQLPKEEEETQSELLKFIGMA
jgi:hypothetical protein